MSHSGMTKGTAKEYFKTLKTEQVGVPCKTAKSCNPFSNITVQIVVLQESSGNRQFYTEAKDNDKLGDTFRSNCLTLSTWQSKHFDLFVEDPVERATHDAMKLLKFFNKTKDELVLLGFTEEEKEMVNKSFDFWSF